MVAVIVAAHGHLAEGLIASSAMIVGPQEDAVAVTFDPSEGPDDLLAKYAAATDASPSTEYLLLVDLFGGSPYNAAARFAAPREDADVVTGVNLPMLVEVLARRMAGAGLAELVEVAGFAPPTMHAVATGLVTTGRPHEVLLVNVPGPASARWLGEQRVRALHAFESTVDDQVISVGVTSLDGRVSFAATATSPLPSFARNAADELGVVNRATK